jgi:RNA polymerase sigma-70 factor (ECF subfamily)
VSEAEATPGRGPAREDSAALYARWRPAVVDLCARRLGNLEEAEATAQEALLRALQAHHAGEVRSFVAYALRVASNLSIDVLRRRRFEARAVAAGETVGSVEAQPEQAELSRMRRAVLELPGPYREVVELHYDHGLSFAEIASVLSMSKNGVFARHERAMALLRARFASRRS